MADLLTRGCIDKIVGGECPESFTVQLLSWRPLQQSDPHRFRLFITDGEKPFKLAVYNDTQTGMALPEKFSILTITDSGSRVFKLQDRFTLLLDNFTVVKEGQDVGRNLLSSGQSLVSPSHHSSELSLVTPPRAEANPSVQQLTPIKTGEQNNLGRREGVKRDLGWGGQSPSKVARTDSTHEVADVNPYRGKIKMKVRVEKKSSPRQINNNRFNGRVQDCVLTDASGSIKMTAWNDNVTELDKLLQGKTYMIESSGNNCKPVQDSRFNSTNHNFEMTLDKNTNVEGPITGDPVQVPYKFVKISEVSNLSANMVVDVLAWVRQVGPVENLRARDGRDLRKREVWLVDDSAGGSSISLILWEDQADTFTESQKVMALRRSVVKEFNGRKNLSINSQSSYEMSPSCAGAEDLQRWAEGVTALPGSLSVNNNQINSGGTNPVSSIQEIKDALAEDQSEKRFTVYGISIKINTDKMWYRAHKPSAGGVCRKKVEPTSPDSNLYNCRCGERNLPESQTELRFLVNLCISDSTSHVWAVMFEAESFLGLTAQDLNDKRKANEAEFDKLISAANFVSMKFSVSAKVDSFNGSPRSKFTIHKAERLWTGSEEGENVSQEMVSSLWKKIIQMEREMEISHEEEYGIDIPGQAELGNIAV